MKTTLIFLTCLMGIANFASAAGKCDAQAEKIAVETAEAQATAFTDTPGENVKGEIQKDYSRVIDSIEDFQTTYSFLVSVDRIDFTVVVTVSEKNCTLLGSYAYQSSFN